MKQRKSITTHLIVLVGLLAAVFGFSGCSSSGSSAPELQIGGVKFSIDDTKMEDFLKAGFAIGEKGKPYSKDKKIPKMTITQDCELLRDDITIADIALKNSAKGEESIGSCTAYYIGISPSGGTKGEQALAYHKENVMVEGAPLFSSKPEDLLVKLEKKFGKENIQVLYFKPDDMIVQHLKREKGLDIDVSKRVAVILYMGDRAKKDNVEWRIGFDLETQMGNSLSIRKSVPMAEKKS